MDNNLASIRHERSKKDFPGLKLEDDEYIEFVFTRAKVCLFAILIGTAGGVILVLLAFLLTLLNQTYIDEMGRHFLFIILFAMMAAAVLIGTIALRIYRGNRLFITNKHVIQLVMTSPVATSMNIIELFKIEDVSYKQEGILQKMFGYGTFRMSTVGDETTYTFKYSDISMDDLKAVSKLVSNAKKIAKQD